MDEREKIEDLLDEYRNAVAARVRAQVDAGACGTATDFRRMHRAEEEEAVVRDRVVASLALAGSR